MEKCRKILQDGLSLAGDGKLDAALSMLEEGLQIAGTNQDAVWIKLLSRNAGLLCERIGDLTKAVAYYEQSLQHDKGNPYTYLALGELYAKLGNEIMSSACLNSCYEIATLNKDQDLVDLLEEKGFKK